MAVNIEPTHRWALVGHDVLNTQAVYVVLNGYGGVMEVSDALTTAAQVVTALQGAYLDAELQNFSQLFSRNPGIKPPLGATRIGVSLDGDPYPVQVVKAVAQYLGQDKHGDTGAALKAGIEARLGIV